MIGRHRGPKQKLASGWLQRAVTKTDVTCCDAFECGIAHFLFAMRVFDVWASSSSPRLPVCQISFLSQPPLLS